MLTCDEFRRFMRAMEQPCEEVVDSTDGASFCVVTDGGAEVTLYKKSKLDETMIRAVLAEEPS